MKQDYASLLQLHLYSKNTENPSDRTRKITQVKTNNEASVFNQGNVVSTSRPETFLSTCP